MNAIALSLLFVLEVQSFTLPVSHRSSDTDGLTQLNPSLYDLISSAAPQIYVIAPGLSPMSLLMLPYLMNGMLLQGAMTQAQTSTLDEFGNSMKFRLKACSVSEIYSR